jgi:hypothetical protein
MSDSAFKTAAFPGYTTAELEKSYAEKSAIIGYGAHCEKIQAELDRRYAVAAGDVSQMTPGERLRFAKSKAGA